MSECKLCRKKNKNTTGDPICNECHKGINEKIEQCKEDTIAILIQIRDDTLSAKAKERISSKINRLSQPTPQYIEYVQRAGTSVRTVWLQEMNQIVIQIPLPPEEGEVLIDIERAP